MKKLTLTLGLFLAISPFVHAQVSQWTTSGANIYYNTGNVGIGNSAPNAKLTVFSTIPLGSSPMNSILVSSIGSKAGTSNDFKNNVWLVRNSSGSDWLSARLHDGISVDGSFMSPQVDTRTWWERDPSKDIQSWGNATNAYLTINKGNVGIGTTTPDEKLVVNGNIKMVLEPAFPTKNNVRITTLGFSGPTGAVNWAIRGVYQYGPGVNFNADGGDLDIIKSWDGNTILGTKSDGTALGNVGIGLTYPQNKLDVNGTIHSKAVKIDLNGWPDYVFKQDYQLLPLKEVKTYINQNQHLPEIPSEQEMVKNGLDVGEINKLLIKKVEELTLYLIEKDKEIKETQIKNLTSDTRLDKQQRQIDQLIKQVQTLSKSQK